MPEIGNLSVEVFPAVNGRVLLRVTGGILGLETSASIDDIARLSGYLGAEVTKLEGEKEEKVDRELVHRIVTAGLRSLARKNHPDARGSHAAMVEINKAADWIRKHW